MTGLVAITDVRAGVKAVTDKPGLVPITDAMPGVEVAGENPLAGAPELPVLRRMLDSHRSSTQLNAKLQQKDRDYYDGHQLNAEVMNTLRLRHQPAIYTNRIRPAIDGTLGVMASAQTDPRAYPRNPHPAQENAADVVTKTLRYIADTNHFAATKLDCAEEHQIEGTCAAIIEVGDGDDITVTQIPQMDFFHDPRSRRSDFKDAKYLGTAKWMYADDVRDLYPERYAALGDPVGGQLASDLARNDETENLLAWVDTKDRRLMLVEVYFRDKGDWWRCVFCSSGVFEFGKSAYVDEKGRTRSPVRAQSCYVDRKGNRYGRVRDMVPIQDEINARRSRLLHLANSRQIQEVEKGAAIVDADTARGEAARADGIIPAGWQMVPTADLAAGQQLLLGESKSEIERMAPTPAVLGRQGEAGQSGRARLVLQQAGMTEIARPMGRFEDFEEGCYGDMFLCARQFWRDPKYIRVTDDVRAPQFLQINTPATEPVLDEQGQLAVGPNGKPVTRPRIDPKTGQQATDNNIAEMDMDIIVDTVPDTANLQQEVFADLKELVSGGLDPFSPQFALLVEMSPLANKQEVLERIKAVKAEMAQDQQGAQQQQAAAQQAAMQADLAVKHAQALQYAANADKLKSDSESEQATTFATLGPIAASFGIVPTQEGVGHAIARIDPANAPPPGSMPAPPPQPPEAQPGQPQQPQQPGAPA